MGEELERERDLRRERGNLREEGGGGRRAPGEEGRSRRKRRREKEKEKGKGIDWERGEIVYLKGKN